MESISRISGLLESARDLTLEAARDASALRKPPSQSIPIATLRKLLDSRNEREVLDGLRRVITLSHRKPPPPGPPLLFSSVIKNIANPSIAVKKLVYIYLLEYAEAEPDTALLAINTIQKTLSAPDPHLRALALRVMSGIRVPVISQIVSLAIKKGSTDISPIVRKAAAMAIPKCWRLDAATNPQLLEYLSVLLGDRQHYVSGAAVIAFLECCPKRIELLHKHYRSLVRKLVDMDEWAQLALLRCMTVYGRRCFPQKTRRVKKSKDQGMQKTPISTRSFYGEDDDDSLAGADGHGGHDLGTNNSGDDYETVSFFDPDLILLLKAALPLLRSRNSAVITAVTRLYLYLSPPPPRASNPATTSTPTTTNPEHTYLQKCIGPLISLLRSPLDMQQIALHNILQVALLLPQSFLPYTTHFLLRGTDPDSISVLKIELLSILFPHASHHVQSLILSELSHSFRSTPTPGGTSNVRAGGTTTSPLLTASVRALGRCAASTTPGSATSTRCLRLLLAQLTSPNGALVAESLTVIRHLIQADPSAHVATVIRLAKTLDTMVNPQARATVVWLVGEFAGVGTEDGGGNAGKGNIAADVLRLLAKGFADEAEGVKLQIVLLAAKVYVHHLNQKQQRQEQQQQEQQREYRSTYEAIPEEEEEGKGNEGDKDISTELDPISLLWTYIIHLVRYDPSYSLRTRARLYKSLLSVPSTTQLATLLLLAPKPVPHATSPAQVRQGFTLGSASLVVGPDVGVTGGGMGFNGYEAVPEWVVEGREPDACLREDDAGAAGAYGEYKPVVSASQRLDAMAGHGVTTKFGRQPGMEGIASPIVAEKSLDDWLAEDEHGGRSYAQEENSEEETEDEENEDEEEEEEDEEGETDGESTEEEGDDDDEEDERSTDDERDERANLVR